MRAPLSPPRVGVGVIVVREGRLLLGLRRSAHGEGTWAVPGGHLEHGESIEACALRELAEETGLVATRVTLGPYTNDVFVETRKHYVTLFAIVHDALGEPRVLEPDKCAEWGFFAWSAMPSPLFAPLARLRETGFVP